MKVIFLDIDGVLNSIQFSKKRYEKYKKTGKWDIAIDDNQVKMLKEIIDKSGGPDEVKVVLSSRTVLSAKLLNPLILISFIYILLTYCLSFYYLIITYLILKENKLNWKNNLL